MKHGIHKCVQFKQWQNQKKKSQTGDWDICKYKPNKLFLKYCLQGGQNYNLSHHQEKPFNYCSVTLVCVTAWGIVVLEDPANDYTFNHIVYKTINKPQKPTKPPKKPRAEVFH